MWGKDFHLDVFLGNADAADVIRKRKATTSMSHAPSLRQGGSDEWSDVFSFSGGSGSGGGTSPQESVLRTVLRTRSFTAIKRGVVKSVRDISNINPLKLFASGGSGPRRGDGDFRSRSMSALTVGSFDRDLETRSTRERSLSADSKRRDPIDRPSSAPVTFDMARQSSKTVGSQGSVGPPGNSV